MGGELSPRAQQRAAAAGRLAADTADTVRSRMLSYRDPAAKVERARKRAKLGLLIRLVLLVVFAVLTWQAFAAYDWVAGGAVGMVTLAAGWATIGSGRHLHALNHMQVPVRPPRLPPLRSIARKPMDRLRAREATLHGLLRLLGPVAADTQAEADAAAAALRDYAARLVTVESAARSAAGGRLDDTARSLAARLDAGVEAYERMVAAAADAVAVTEADGAPDPVAMRTLGDATDRLSGLAAGLREVRGIE